MNERKKRVSGKKRGVPSRDELYRKVAGKVPEAINYVVGVMKGTRRANSVRLGAAKLLINKALPDLKVQEITGEGGGPIDVRVIKDYISEPSNINATSATGAEEQDKV